MFTKFCKKTIFDFKGLRRETECEQTPVQNLEENIYLDVDEANRSTGHEYSEIENVSVAPPDIISSATIKDVVNDMGQKPSHLRNVKTTSVLTQSKPPPKLSLSWILRNQDSRTRTPNPEQPIKFQYKTRRKSVELTTNNIHNTRCREKIIIASDSYNNQVRLNNEINVVRTKSEPTLNTETRTSRENKTHRHKKRSSRSLKHRFGYEINDVDAFLTKASLEKPANIPVVLAFPSVLYQTRVGGYQEEIGLPLGMVVNAVFKNQSWLYVQTPHAEEGYVNYKACLPLGILPPRDDEPAPCWEKSNDVFPKPCGNMTDTEKLSSKSECSGTRCRSRTKFRSARSACGERSVDKLYLKATANNCGNIIKQQQPMMNRHTLLVIDSDFVSDERNTLSVSKGDVVVLLNAQLKDWFWVRTKDGQEGFIPAVIAGHGYL